MHSRRDAPALTHTTQSEVTASVTEALGKKGQVARRSAAWIRAVTVAALPAARAATVRARRAFRRGACPPDFDPEIVAIYGAVRAYTLTSPERVHALCKAVEHLCTHGIPGAIVECGVYRGGSMMAAALTLKRCGDTSRDLFLFDTFDGMPPPTDVDVDIDGRSASELPPSLRRWPSMAGVLDRMLSTGYPPERIHLVRGRVEETLPESAPETIALLRLDTDWYESTRHEMIHLFPRLSPGGVLIVDDYGYWEGARRAVDEYVATSGVPVLLHRVDVTGRVAVKPR